MRWIGQHIWPFKSRFRSDAILEKNSSLWLGGDEVLSQTGGNVTLANISAIDADTTATLNSALTAGDITGVTAGTGLDGGGSSGNVTLDVNASLSHVTTLAGLTSFGSAGATTNILAGDIDWYNPVTNGNPKLKIGVDAAECLQITSYYQSGTQSMQLAQFVTKTASGTADDGRFQFFPDEVKVLAIDDGGINFEADMGISIDGTDIITDSSGTATLSNIDAIDATTEATIEAAIETRLHYPFRGYCLGIASRNFQFAEDMTDNQFPVQLNSDYGDTVIANGSLDDVSTYFRSSGTVMPRACTAVDMVGWASCPGTGEVTISLCKVTPTRDDSTTDPTPVVVATTTFTALNSNDKLEDFSVGDSGGDGTVTIVTAAIAKGDILMPFVLSPDTKTTYFNMTLEVKG